MPKNAVKMGVFQKEWVLKQYIFDEKQNIVQYYYTRIGFSIMQRLNLKVTAYDQNIFMCLQRRKPTSLQRSVLYGFYRVDDFSSTTLP